jgi:tetratricopeptide (TPR) repeat protein
LLRGQLALEAGHHEEAEALLRRAIAASPYEAQGCYSLSCCLRQLGQLGESAALMAKFDRMTADFHRYSALTEQMRTESRNPAVLCEAGTIQLRNGMVQNGLGWLASALHADPEYAPAHLALARYYQEAGDHKQSQIHRDRALKALAHSLASWGP